MALKEEAGCPESEFGLEMAKILALLVDTQEPIVELLESHQTIVLLKFNLMLVAMLSTSESKPNWARPIPLTVGRLKDQFTVQLTLITLEADA